ncbi:MAG: LemA family protein [Phycisphaerales bacterium]|nr:LemA family protein [Phycisphaerales bacterium]
MELIICPGILLLIGLVWFVVTYNRFVRLRHHMKESWADVDVELQRRYELIPNLVATVKGYAAHEQKVFDAVTSARTAAMASTGDPASQSVDEQRLVGQMGRLFAVAEGYPDLKADENFIHLQEELTNTEDRIAAARRFFNGNVREFNTLRESFPSNLVAAILGLQQAGFFEVEDHVVREAPRVDIDS